MKLILCWRTENTKSLKQDVKFDGKFAKASPGINLEQNCFFIGYSSKNDVIESSGTCP